MLLEKNMRKFLGQLLPKTKFLRILSKLFMLPRLLFLATLLKGISLRATKSNLVEITMKTKVQSRRTRSQFRIAFLLPSECKCKVPDTLCSHLSHPWPLSTMDQEGGRRQLSK